MLEVRIRACHVHGRFIAKDNQPPKMSVVQALEQPRRDTNRVVLPPASFAHEQEKVNQRWPAAIEFIKQRKLNETFAGDMHERCADLEMHLVERAGHWIQQEHPGVVNRHLLGWLARVASSSVLRAQSPLCSRTWTRPSWTKAVK